MSRTKRLLTVLAILSGASGAAAEETPIHAVPAPATAAQIRKLLAGGFEVRSAVDDNTSYKFLDSGRASFFTGEVPSFSCKSPQPYTVQGRSIRFQCQLVRYAGDGTPGPSHRESFQLEIEQLSADAILYREDTSWVPGTLDDPHAIEAPDPHGTEAVLAVSRGSAGQNMAASFEIVIATTVELVPGAKDRALFDALERRIRAGTPGLGSDFVFFEGPPARDPRVESEVFYVGDGNRQAAEAVAGELAPVIGRVTPKPWPGSWRFNVVVVAGSRAAAGPGGK